MRLRSAWYFVNVAVLLMIGFINIDTLIFNIDLVFDGRETNFNVLFVVIAIT